MLELVEIIINDDHQVLASIVVDSIEAMVRQKPDSVLGVATGSTPIPIYQELARRVQAGLDLSRIRIFGLDEYVSLDETNEQSYAYFIRENIIEPCKINPANVRLLSGVAEDLRAEAASFEAAIKAAGGVDLQILGVGHNGHIAFNEPTSSLASRTRRITLTEKTIEANSRFYPSIEDVPHQAITQGIGTILEARHLVMLAYGEEKAYAVKEMIEGPVAAMMPASALQLHSHVSVLVDEGAASTLQKADYYKYEWDSKTEKVLD